VGVGMNKDMLDALSEPFPRHAIKQREGGAGRRFDYVETQTVIRRLNAVAGEWSFAIKSLELRGDLYVCVGSLTIPGLGTREGIGVQKVSDRGGEDLVKGAASDALKKSATLFGVALDLYGPDLESGEVAQPPQSERTHRNAPQARQDAPRAATPAPTANSLDEAEPLVTDQQSQALIRLANRRKVAHTTVAAESMKRFGNSPHAVRFSQFRELWDWLEAYKPPPADAPDAPSQQTLTNADAPIEEPDEEWMR
jgi:hypothetical protein